LSGVRVTYAGLISFSTGILSILTGLAFMIIVTRTLSPEEYGTWGVITGLLVYAMVFDTIIGYWAQRDIARGVESGKTSILSSGLFSILGIIIYFISSFFVGTQSHLDYNILFLAIILVPLRSFQKILSAINSGWKPEVNSYAILVSEIIKIPIGIILIYILEMKVEGIILTFAISFLAGIIIQLIYARHKIKDQFKKAFLRKWLSLVWIPIIPKIVALLRSSDIIIFSILTGSVIGIAYYSASLIIATLVAGAGSISGSVVTKLLAGGNQDYMKENFRLLLYFLIPFTAFSLSFSRAGLFVLNPFYEIAYTVVIILTLQTVMITFSNTFSTFLFGIENVDRNKDSSYKDYIKSKLFFVPTIKLIQYGLYLLTLSIMLILVSNKSEIELVVYWSILSLITQIPITIYLSLEVRKKFKLELDYLSISKYCLISIFIFGSTYWVIENLIEFNTSLFKFLPNIVILALIGFFGYFIITFFIDKKTRKLVNLVLQELKK
jgi:O-antigen/teichoic acid export membrane protein